MSVKTVEKEFCQDFGHNPRCLRDADERYIMRFDEIGQPPIHWCAHCGPVQHHLLNAMLAKLEREPESRAVLAGMIDAAEAKAKREAS